MKGLESVEGFDWDDGNREKNWNKHGVKSVECEMIFFNQPLVIIADEKHSQIESRHYAFGKTDFGRGLLVVFCIRKNRIRVISARDMHKKERQFYEEH